MIDDENAPVESVNAPVGDENVPVDKEDKTAMKGEDRNV